MKKELDCEPIYIKNKMKCYNDEATDFHDK